MAKSKELKEYRTLSCPLNDEELKEKGATMAAKRALLNKTIDAKKSTASAYKSEIDGINADLDSLASAIREKQEMRSIECVWRRDDGRGLMTLLRTDTGTVLSTRAMTDLERQLELVKNDGDAVSPVASPEAKAKTKSKRKTKSNGAALDLVAPAEAPSFDGPSAA